MDSLPIVVDQNGKPSVSTSTNFIASSVAFLIAALTIDQLDYARMRRILITTSLVGLISLGLFPAQGIAQYRFDNWTTDDGLPQNSVSAILQTRDGYLWWTTAAGLVRFDGLRFTIFDKSNTKGLTSVRFSPL